MYICRDEYLHNILHLTFTKTSVKYSSFFFNYENKYHRLSYFKNLVIFSSFMFSFSMLIGTTPQEMVAILVKLIKVRQSKNSLFFICFLILLSLTVMILLYIGFINKLQFCYYNKFHVFLIMNWRNKSSHESIKICVI